MRERERARERERVREKETKERRDTNMKEGREKDTRGEEANSKPKGSYGFQWKTQTPPLIYEEPLGTIVPKIAKKQ